jgi:hypothetical protein
VAINSLGCIILLGLICLLGYIFLRHVYIGRAARGPRGPTDRATYGLRAEAAAHGPPDHRAGPLAARKVRIGPAQVPGRFYGPWTGPRITGQMANFRAAGKTALGFMIQRREAALGCRVLRRAQINRELERRALASENLHCFVTKGAERETCQSSSIKLGRG